MAKKKTVKKAVKKPVKKTAKAPVKKSAKKPAVKRLVAGRIGASPELGKQKHKLYIESAAFFPANSSDGYVDHFQDGRRTAVANRALVTPIIIPVGAVLKSISIHYTNSTTEAPLAFFLRKHQDRHSPSGEIEMSFISLPPGILPPDNYLTVTDTSFPDAGVIQDKFLHYLEISGTGDFGAEGKRTVRGVSLVYQY